MRLNIAERIGRIPTEGELKYSIWVTKGTEQVFVPTDVPDGGWYLIELDNPNNGYNGGGRGWDTAREMYDAVGDQFAYLIPFDSLEVTAHTTIKI